MPIPALDSFEALAHDDSLQVAALVALGLSLLVLLPDALRHRAKVLDLSAAAFFLTLSVAALCWLGLDQWKDWASPAGNGALAALILVTNLAGASGQRV